MEKEKSTHFDQIISIPRWTTNPDTGEIVEANISIRASTTDKSKVIAARKRGAGKIKQSPYTTWNSLNTSDDSLYLRLLCDCNLTQTDKTIWHGYASYIRLGNWVCTQQKLIAKRLLCDVTTISIATKKLVELGYLERKERGSCEYRIPKAMSYCGSWKHFATSDDEFNKDED